MEIMKRYILYIILFNIVFCVSNISRYNINLYGIKVAECNIEIADTLFYGIESIKLDYQVKSSNFMKLLFNVNNHYTTIISKNDDYILFFGKKTYQPKLINEIETFFLDSLVQYQDSNYKINKGEYNIFSLLYMISNKNIKDLQEEVILDREGKKYFCKINKDKNKNINIVLFEKNSSDLGLIKNTDIFTWAFFMKNTRNTIILDVNLNTIKSCKFRKGLTILSANKIE